MQKLNKLLMVLVLSAALTGCSSQIPNTQITTIHDPIIDPNPPEPVNLGDINFKIYNSSELKNLAANPNIFVFVLTNQDVTTLGNNLAQMQNYILEQNAELEYYRTQNAQAASQK